MESSEAAEALIPNFKLERILNQSPKPPVDKSKKDFRKILTIL